MQMKYDHFINDPVLQLYHTFFLLNVLNYHLKLASTL